MKVWYHVIAAVVGFSTAALIVFLVFGNASEEGARPSSAAPEGLGSEASLLCGTVDPDAANSAATRKLAGENFPAIYDAADNPITAISADKPLQQGWIERVHAASGLCIDEIRFVETGVQRITMSTVGSITDEQASELAGGVLLQAFTAPFNPREVTLVATVGDTERTAVVSVRAWNAFQAARRQLRQPATMQALAQFRAARYTRPDLRVVGWR